MLRLDYFEIPKPKTFLYFLDLQVGTELIIFFSILNKASGIYGFIAILTNHSFLNISLWKMFMYFYSLFALFACVMMIKYIRTESPFHLLIYAYFYFIDTFISSIYSAIFAIIWLMDILKNAIISSGIEETVDHFQKSEIFKSWHPDQSVYVYDTSLMSFSIEKFFTILILCFFLCLKIYFCLVVFSYARYSIIRAGNIHKCLRNEWVRKLVHILTYGEYWKKADDISHKVKCSLELKVRGNELENGNFYDNRI
ncbi:hypothetical protein PMAC_000489 [Pneumocystis sp. 'macacae']|nr:hypothetical protein PMAC_000489 [Pneumocystis sp. 'macacae']